MKTSFNSIIAVFTLILISVSTHVAQAFTDGGINYTVLSAATAAVASNKSASGEIVIPSQVTYNGTTYTVTEISAEAFSSSNITSIKLPETITSIGGNAFLNTNLTQLIIPNSVKTIGDGSFALCSNLRTLQLGSSIISIGKDIFTGLSALKTVISLNPTPPTVNTWGTTTTSATLYVPESAISAYSSAEVWKKFIKIEAYSGGNLSMFGNLTELTVGNQVTQINSGFFSNNANLKSLTLGSGLTAIGDNTFSGCAELTEVVVPVNVETIGASAFAGCSKLANIIMGAKVKSIGEKAFDGCPASVVSITAPQPPTAPNNTFSNYSGKLYLQGQEAIDAYYDAYTCWDRFDSYEMVEPTALKVSKANVAGKPGDTIQLTATLEPDNVTLPQIFWRSTNTDVAMVNNTGLVTFVGGTGDSATARAAAECKIIAESLYADGPVAEVSVDGTSIEVSDLSFKKDSYSATPGKTLDLNSEIIIEPENATDKTLTWTSSDESVATVSNGIVTVLAEGTCTITASTTDGSNLSATCTVISKANPISVSGLSFKEDSYSAAPGKTLDLNSEIIIEPENATDKTLTWTSSDESVATVSNGIVTVLAEGILTITATTTDGSNLSATCTVISKANLIPVSSLSFKEDSYSAAPGKTLDLNSEIIIEPENATDKTLTWTSSDESVATVSNGIVTVLAEGTCTITATTTDGSNLSATCTVISKANPIPVSSLSFKQDSYSAAPGKTLDLNSEIIIEPENATDKTLTWTSSDESVATVSNGIVTVLAEGILTITAATTDGSNLSATCTVVSKANSGVEAIMDADTPCDVYSMDGILIMRDAILKDVTLAPGIYIIHQGGRTYKVNMR